MRRTFNLEPISKFEILKLAQSISIPVKYLLYVESLMRPGDNLLNLIGNPDVFFSLTSQALFEKPEKVLIFSSSFFFEEAP
jgi:hypothetical protein